MERKEAGSQSFEAVVNKGKEVDSSPSPAAKNWKEDDYCHSINLIRQAQFMIGGDKLGLEGLPYVQTYLPSKEDIRTANKINRNMGDVGTTSNPPTPEQWLMHTLLWFLSRFLPWWSKLSFNRGVGSKGFPRLVKDLCGPYHSNILCLLETRISGTKATNIARKFGFSSWHLVEGVGFSGDTGGVSNLSRDHHRFAVCLLDSELHDIGFQGEPFTWQRETIRRRLDRYVANNSWSLQFSQALVKHLPKLKYDYVPILLNLDYHGLMVFSANLSFEPNPFLEDLQLEDLLIQEEIYWKQCSRCTWLNYGNKNTSYFHGVATSRKRRKRAFYGSMFSSEDYQRSVTNAVTNRILHHTIGLPDFTQGLRCFQTVTCYQAVVNNLEDAHEMLDTAISTTLKESKPVYISISCNLAAIPYPTFSREPVPFSLSPKLSNQMGLEAVVEAAADFHGNMSV
ncbi:hypothetical protein AHAS_Ahas16G0233400 [Arachis hypogaea]